MNMVLTRGALTIPLVVLAMFRATASPPATNESAQNVTEFDALAANGLAGDAELQRSALAKLRAAANDADPTIRRNVAESQIRALCQTGRLISYPDIWDDLTAVPIRLDWIDTAIAPQDCRVEVLSVEDQVPLIVEYWLWRGDKRVIAQTPVWIDPTVRIGIPADAQGVHRWRGRVKIDSLDAFDKEDGTFSLTEDVSFVVMRGTPVVALRHVALPSLDDAISSFCTAQLEYGDDAAWLVLDTPSWMTRSDLAFGAKLEALHSNSQVFGGADWWPDKRVDYGGTRCWYRVRLHMTEGGISTGRSVHTLRVTSSDAVSRSQFDRRVSWKGSFELPIRTVELGK